MQWDWIIISVNRNLTEEFIGKNISKLYLNKISHQLFTNKLNLLKKEYDGLMKLFYKEFFYQISVKMHNPVTKGYYYRRDMKNLFAPNISDLIINFKKKYNIEMNLKIKNYLFEEIFKIQIEKNFFDFQDEDIFKILSNM